jgi:hypothetical protein
MLKFKEWTQGMFSKTYAESDGQNSAFLKSKPSLPRLNPMLIQFSPQPLTSLLQY